MTLQATYIGQVVEEYIRFLFSLCGPFGLGGFFFLGAVP